MLFSKPGYISIKDPFKQVAVASLRSNKNEHEVGGHDAPFRPTKNMKEKVKAAYENRPEGVPERREIKDEDGNVMTQEPNMKTMPMKKGKVGKNIYF